MHSLVTHPDIFLAPSGYACVDEAKQPALHEVIARID